MKRIYLLKMALAPTILFSALMLFVTCQKENKEDWTEEINLLVYHQFVNHYLFGAEEPLAGINTKEEKSSLWVSLHKNEIEGFEYEEGYEYKLKVLKTHLGNPPMDGANFKYKLINIILKTEK